MSTGLLQLIKQASMDAVDNAQMCDLRFGTVVSTSPLKIQITNQLTIPTSLLIVPEHLTDHTVNVTMSWSTGTSESHSHSVGGTNSITIHNALKIGDTVALLRKQGGQSYFVLDRI